MILQEKWKGVFVVVVVNLFSVVDCCHFQKVVLKKLRRQK
jgi:ribosomal protein L4